MSTKIDDGGSAFPLALPDGEHRDDSYGMSLRDWFAGMAMLSLLPMHNVLPHGFTAEESYAVADAMLSERAKGGT